jgi:hypothetical protein
MSNEMLQTNTVRNFAPMLRIYIDLDKITGASIIERFGVLVMITIPKDYAVLRQFGFNSNLQKIAGAEYVVRSDGKIYVPEKASDTPGAFQIRCVQVP